MEKEIKEMICAILDRGIKSTTSIFAEVLAEYPEASKEIVLRVFKDVIRTRYMGGS